jgi:hypothetical protein
MTTPQIIATILTAALAVWCIAMLVAAGEWALVLGTAVVSGGALVHAAVLAVRGQIKAADALLMWAFAGMIVLVAFAAAIRFGPAACD